MSREWKPGDVAMIPFSAGEARAMWTEDGWTAVGHGRSKSFVGIRPLVVIDPENGTDVKRLIKAVMAHGYERAPGRGDMQAALRSLIVPEKPAEPTGWGAVVEDESGHYWTLVARESRLWIHVERGTSLYSAIAVVRVVSEGVTQ